MSCDVGRCCSLNNPSYVEQNLSMEYSKLNIRAQMEFIEARRSLEFELKMNRFHRINGVVRRLLCGKIARAWYLWLNFNNVSTYIFQNQLHICMSIALFPSVFCPSSIKFKAKNTGSVLQ